MVKEFGLPWIAHLLLQFFIGAIWGAVIRLVRGRVLWAVIYLLTGGFFGIGWIYDFVMLIIHRDYKLA
ncbi:MAG: hypothetical protein BWX74_00585 [Tenericutes bacterium ADurb.Bin087]|nr:MAG: hypothetical protein BWX74_00585 [Tenericutes bacterium ADurb.Bin087]